MCFLYLSWGVGGAARAACAGGVNVSSTWDVIKAFPVFNPHTDYSVVMVPATGYYSGVVWMG